jgi:hypothetical protein
MAEMETCPRFGGHPMTQSHHHEPVNLLNFKYDAATVPAGGPGPGTIMITRTSQTAGAGLTFRID